MEPYLLIGIDPGASGGIAWADTELGTSGAAAMPECPYRLADLLDDLKLKGICWVYLEKVHSMPGQGVASTYKFGESVGVIKGITAALAIPVIMVSPQKWQKTMELPRGIQFKKERKHRIRDLMQARYPHIKVNLKTADALAIMTYALDFDPSWRR